jgi:hypothetical protein
MPLLCLIRPLSVIGAVQSLGAKYIAAHQRALQDLADAAIPVRLKCEYVSLLRSSRLTTCLTQ